MTNAELIQKIRAEIERRIEELNKDKYISIDAQVCRTSELKYLLRFLSTLESKKPMNQDLEKELARFYLKDLCGSEKDEIPEATLHHNFPIMWDDLRDIARHFAQWGAEHLKK